MKPVIVSFYTAGTPYEQDAAKLAASCVQYGYEADVVPVPERSWDEAVRLKPDVLRDAMGRHPGKPILLLDADCWLEGDPAWLHEDQGRIALHVLEPHEIPLRRFAQRHKHQARRYGGMWQSGRVLFRAEGMGEILDAWAAELEARANDWGDQMALQLACRRLGIAATVMPREMIKEALRHSSGFHRHWQKAAPQTPQRRVLVLGSAPGVVEWWREHRDWYVREGYVVAALNNAWQVPNLEDLHLWLHPNDFDGCGPPDEVPCNETWDYAARGYQVSLKSNNWIIGPHWLRGVRLTMTDALVHLLNEAIADGVELTVHVAGCDMQYPQTGPTHFYGTGQPDPLRYEAARLDAALREVAGYYESAKAILINASTEAETRLPFQRRELAA